MRLRHIVPALAMTGVAALSSLALNPAAAAATADTDSTRPRAQVVDSTLGTNGAAASYQLRNANTGRCIDDSFAYGLRAYPCNGLDFQKWNLNGGLEWRNVNTGRCIDDSIAYGLRAVPCNGLNFQQWWYDNGAQRNVNTGRCIDDSAAYGLRAYSCNGLNYQQWSRTA
ncbi:RICIN domain-containing protein [Streptomyces sp. JW3]|uniref:RICIN domain-containing protein n=1 Tax=Streptomyces sp. JW3 TaxID=3456955 RepID=UPI003FA4BCF0